MQDFNSHILPAASPLHIRQLLCGLTFTQATHVHIADVTLIPLLVGSATYPAQDFSPQINPENPRLGKYLFPNLFP